MNRGEAKQGIRCSQTIHRHDEILSQTLPPTALPSELQQDKVTATTLHWNAR